QTLQPADAEAVERSLGFLGVSVDFDSLDSMEPDPSAAMANLLQTFEKFIAQSMEVAPIHRPFGELSIGSTDLVSFLEDFSEGWLQNALRGGESAWPEQFSNPYIIRQVEENIFPSIRESFASLPAKNAAVVETVVNTKEIGEKIEEGANAQI